jgi:hypothetical protein
MENNHDGWPDHWPKWVADRFSEFYTVIDAVSNHLLVGDAEEPWTDKAAMSPAKIFLSKINWKNPTASGPSALATVLGSMERFIEEETLIEDYMQSIDSVEEKWPILQQALLSVPALDVFEECVQSLETNNPERKSLQNFLAEAEENESDPAEMAQTYHELIQNIIDLKPMVQTLSERSDEIISIIRSTVSISAEQPSREMQDFLSAYNRAYEAEVPDFDHWAPHEKVHIHMLLNHKNVSKMENGAVLRRWIVRLLGASDTYNQRRIDKIRERLTLKLSTRGRPKKNTTG